MYNWILDRWGSISIESFAKSARKMKKISWNPQKSPEIPAFAQTKPTPG